MSCQEIRHFNTQSVKPAESVYVNTEVLLRYSSTVALNNSKLKSAVRRNQRIFLETYHKRDPCIDSILQNFDTRKLIPLVSTILSSYLSTISTHVVYTAMKNFYDLCLNNDIAVLFCDMSIYSIAKNIQLSSNQFPVQ